jgi:hypothetical protein
MMSDHMTDHILCNVCMQLADEHSGSRREFCATTHLWAVQGRWSSLSRGITHCTVYHTACFSYTSLSCGCLPVEPPVAVAALPLEPAGVHHPQAAAASDGCTLRKRFPSLLCLASACRLSLLLLLLLHPPLTPTPLELLQVFITPMPLLRLMAACFSCPPLLMPAS